MCPDRAFQLARVETGSVCGLFLLAATVQGLSPRLHCSYASPEHTKLGLQQLRGQAPVWPPRQRALSDHGHHVLGKCSQRARVLPPSRLHRQTVGRLAGQELQPPQRILPDAVAHHARNVSQAAGFARPEDPSGWSARGIQSRRQVEIIGNISCWEPILREYVLLLGRCVCNYLFLTRVLRLILRLYRFFSRSNRWPTGSPTHSASVYDGERKSNEVVQVESCGDPEGQTSG